MADLQSPGAVARFWWGLSRPFLLIARLRDEPVAFKAWVKTVSVSAALTLVLGSVLFVRDLEDLTHKARAHRSREAVRELERARRELKAAGAETKDVDDALKLARQALGDKQLEQLRKAKGQLAALDDGGVLRASGLDRLFDALEDGGVGAEPRAAEDSEPPAQAQRDGGLHVRGAVRVDLPPWLVRRHRVDAGVAATPPTDEEDADSDDDEDDGPPQELDAPREEALPTWLWKRLLLWASSLVVVQSVLLALTRDYHDRMARDLSLVAGLEPEDQPGKPGVRVDVKWLWRKLRRRVRGFLTTAAGVAVLSPLIVLGALLDRADEAAKVVVGLASAYWWVVFSGARSARAWRTEDDLTPPTPLRALEWMTLHLPGFRWFVPKGLLRFAVWGSRSMFAPARAIERDVAAFLGLSVARLIGSIPVVRLALRTALVVTAGELLEATAALEPYDVRQLQEPEAPPATTEAPPPAAPDPA